VASTCGRPRRERVPTRTVRTNRRLTHRCSPHPGSKVFQSLLRCNEGQRQESDAGSARQPARSSRAPAPRGPSDSAISPSNSSVIVRAGSPRANNLPRGPMDPAEARAGDRCDGAPPRRPAGPSPTGAAPGGPAGRGRPGIHRRFQKWISRRLEAREAPVPPRLPAAGERPGGKRAGSGDRGDRPHRPGTPRSVPGRRMELPVGHPLPPIRWLSGRSRSKKAGGYRSPESLTGPIPSPWSPAERAISFASSKRSGSPVRGKRSRRHRRSRPT